MCKFAIKIIVYIVDFTIITTAFSTSINSAFANDYSGQVLGKKYNYKTTHKEVSSEPFSTKSEDLLISTDDELSIKDRLELFKRNLDNSNRNIEIGESSCYVELSFLSNSIMIYDNYPQIVNKLTFSIYSPTHGMRTVNLESSKNSETMSLKSICSNKIINIVYKTISLERRVDNKIRELKVNLDMQKPVQNPWLELNIQNDWNPLIKKND
ncbi:MAG: hypothetical protein RMZ42_06570 [Nostoc sp. DedQUE05]|uniref:hypothetical protein n=1 Tax=Nostoc sp. DedQUE05 TaxID=3075391 RepID=UPI002AD33118|nr:hypothetical protein [Nostoc sp. DedQUE05]MDZ8091588.1 hypothetical protein [Nostoc sp. DedQUE05]